ncbi:MAG: hypothetical protein GY854_01685, partial [Deltaproteobacteria bacterium]|nr:hypothetical protein [Deltaproteobacteria bacterium]
MISRALFIGLYVFISAACGTNTIEKSPEPTTALDHTLSPAEPKPRESNDEVSKPTKQAAVKPIGKESKDLKKDTGSSVVTGPSDTLITPVLESKIEKGKNSVYCSTFQLAWNTLNELVGDSIKLEGDPPLVHNRLN